MPPKWNGEDIDVERLPTKWITTPGSSRALTLSEMENNAAMFTQYFACVNFTDTDVPYNNGRLEGLGIRETDEDIWEWTPQAIAGILGNMTMESTINPSRWQNDDPPADPDTSDAETGYGLVQWTPFSKYRDWVLQGDPDDPTYPNAGYLPELWGTWQNNGYLQTERIAWERREEKQWIGTPNYNFNFHQFTEKKDSPSLMALYFLYNYERPADPNATQEQRMAWAEYWYYRVTRPIYGYLRPNICYWLFPYVFSKKYMGRWYL